MLTPLISGASESQLSTILSNSQSLLGKPYKVQWSESKGYFDIRAGKERLATGVRLISGLWVVYADPKVQKELLMGV